MYARRGNNNEHTLPPIKLNSTIPNITFLFEGPHLHHRVQDERYRTKDKHLAEYTYDAIGILIRQFPKNKCNIKKVLPPRHSNYTFSRGGYRKGL